MCMLLAGNCLAADKAPKKPQDKCPTGHFAAKVVVYNETAEKVHIELVRVSDGARLEPIEVTKPWHSGYDKKTYKLGAVVCQPDETVTGGV
ncbi:MAG: hypothetical protein K2X12_02640 [Burkholderiaceae bacterium]|nr:hypothetical protein [Burkholderiaceae bacterium]